MPQTGSMAFSASAAACAGAWWAWSCGAWPWWLCSDTDFLKRSDIASPIAADYPEPAARGSGPRASLKDRVSEAPLRASEARALEGEASRPEDAGAGAHRLRVA